MPSKTEEYLALAQRTANGLTRYWESWTDYLTTASRLYKYPFADQLMIYAQRPDATACADFDIWNNRMNRYVRRGAKGIALLDESSGFPRLHYVFDVSDTGVRRNSRDPEVWQLGPDLVQPVSEMLSKTYGISGERVSQQLADVAGKLVADYWDNNGGDIRAIVDGSLLMDYDEAGVEMPFKSAAAISVTYTLLERCGFEPAGWFGKDDFQAIYNFSTPDAVYTLGAAVSDMSREVLRNIERTVKTTIRRRNIERSQYEYEQQERDLLDHRGLPAPEPDSEPAPEAAGQVRQAAPDVPEGPSPGAVQHDAPEREPVPAPEGTGYRARTRFAKFFNLPELMAMFKEAADIKTSDQLHLPVPDAKFETVVVKPSEIQQDMVQALSERAAEVHSGSVDPSVDNMLKITSDGRKIGLDQRLMNSALPDDPNSKLNACVNNVLRIWNDTKEQKLTQLIFCDMSTPKGDGSFNVYDDIRTKLLNAGVPEQEIEFIHNADTENKKAELFSKVRSGQVRVLLGSTAKMGAGTNVQTLLVAVHHLDVGWRPSDMTQRNGRIIRQGNKNKQVYVYNYVTESTFDAYLYQTLENKQKFISQIMTSKSPMRSCDDIDEQALSYAEIKALCAGDPRIREKMDLDVQVAKLKVLRGDFQNQKYRLEDKLLKTFPEEIQKQKNRIAALQQDSQIAAAHPQDKENFCGMTIKGMVYDDKKAAGERLLLARQEMPNADMMLLGTYRGFELNIRFDSFKNEHQAVLRAELSYPVSLGDDARGNITRLDNAIDNFADRIADAENALQNLEQQKQAAEVEVAKPFAQEEELAEKSARLAELNALLNIDRDRSSSQDAPEETEETETPATRPSVLAALGEKTNQPEPVKPFKSYLDKEGR